MTFTGHIHLKKKETQHYMRRIFHHKWMTMGCMKSCLMLCSNESEESRNEITYLIPEIPKWASKVPLTKGQLMSRRDEFWDVAPRLEGRTDIWEALKLATEAFKNGDIELAQAILDSVNLIVPHGTLVETYDQFGQRYYIPIYCLSDPVNLLPDSPPSSQFNLFQDEFEGQGEEIVPKFRLSTTNQDIRIPVYSKEAILSVKRRIFKRTGIQPHLQRLYFNGRMLCDSANVESLNLQNNYVVQVIVSEEDISDLDYQLLNGSSYNSL